MRQGASPPVRRLCGVACSRRNSRINSMASALPSDPMSSFEPKPGHSSSLVIRSISCSIAGLRRLSALESLSCPHSGLRAQYALQHFARQKTCQRAVVPFGQIAADFDALRYEHGRSDHMAPGATEAGPGRLRTGRECKINDMTPSAPSIIGGRPPFEVRQRECRILVSEPSPYHLAGQRTGHSI